MMASADDPTATSRATPPPDSAPQSERSLGDIAEDAVPDKQEPSSSSTASEPLSSPLLLSPNGGESPTIIATPPPALHKRQSYSRLPRRVSQLGNSPSAASPINDRAASPVEGARYKPESDDEMTRLQAENAELRKRLDRAESYATNLESSFRDLTNSPLRPAFASALHPPVDIQDGLDAQAQALPHSKPMFDLKQKISGGNLRAAFRLQQQAQAHASAEQLIAANGDGSAPSLETNGDSRADEDDALSADETVRTPQQSLVNGSTTGKGRYPGLGRGAEDEGRSFSTRTSPAKGELSRIPSSHVQSSVALHAAAQPIPTSAATGIETRPASPLPAGASPRPSPGPRRASSSSKVIDEIKSENDALKTLTEKMRRDLTESRKQVASLHTANEDLKGTRERMRAEVDSLNNVISRKERLLQEVLDRARKAEGEVQVHAKERKAIETTHKQTMNELKNRLGEAEVLSSRSERETTALRDSLKSLKEQWKREVRALRAEIKASAEELRKEKADASRKHSEFVKLVQTQAGSRKELNALEDSSQRLNQQLTQLLQPQIDEMKKTLEDDIADKESSTTIATQLQAELGRLKRLMHSSGDE